MSKKEWGNATWNLFHTLAEKINEEYFLDNKIEFFSIINIICKNLPCPECAEDSNAILKTANLSNINSKQDLQDFFFQFHNKVNAKLKKPIFNSDELIKYKLAITVKIIQNFLNIYFKRRYNEKLLIQSFSVNKVETQIKNFLINLINNNNLSN